MENIQKQFAENLGNIIWYAKEEKKVVLTGVRIGTLLFMNGGPNEREEPIIDFRIIVENEREAVLKNYSFHLTVKELGDKMVKVDEFISPEAFIEKVKEIIYPKLVITEEAMEAKKKARDREFVMARQLIMASVFCAYEYHVVPEYRLSLTKVGNMYGKDHATVIHAIRTVNDLIDSDRQYKIEFENVWGLVRKINPKSRLHI